jgi:MerR family transcriptional regulator, redox-sensitive transcriptional activator SoxR
MSEAKLSIGEVAERAGVSVSAIRYYERNGLLPKAERVGGQRRFDDGVVRRLEVVDVAKRAGFSLDEVRTLLVSIDEGAPAHRQLRALAAHKLPEIDARIERARKCATGSPRPAFAVATRWRSAACSTGKALPLRFDGLS